MGFSVQKWTNVSWNFQWSQLKNSYGLVAIFEFNLLVGVHRDKSSINLVCIFNIFPKIMFFRPKKVYFYKI